MAKKPNGFWIYAIEISPEWIPHLRRRKVPRDTKRLIYVGYSETGPRERFEQHLLGLHHPTNTGLSSGEFFRVIRREREKRGLPGALVEGTDAWLLEDLIETYSTAEAARPREGGLADELNATPGTLAWSNMGEAAAARKATAEARKRKKARRRRRRARKAAESAG